MNRAILRNLSDMALEKKVFKYDSSEADKRFFKQRIVDFLKGDHGKTYTQFMWEAVWERNDGGRTLKYCDFNEYRQKVYLLPTFYEWILRTISKIEIQSMNREQLEEQVKRKMFEFSDVQPIEQKIVFGWNDAIKCMESIASFIEDLERKAFEDATDLTMKEVLSTWPFKIKIPTYESYKQSL